MNTTSRISQAYARLNQACEFWALAIQRKVEPPVPLSWGTRKLYWILAWAHIRPSSAILTVQVLIDLTILSILLTFFGVI